MEPEEAASNLSDRLSKLTEAMGILRDLEDTIYPMVRRRISDAIVTLEEAESILTKDIDLLKKKA